MDFLLRRWIAIVLAITAGAAIGYLIGLGLHAPVLLTWLGAITGLTLPILRDAWKGEQLMRWLRSSQDGPAPRDTGRWGELGYRFERALRQRERVVEQERGQLAQFLAAIEASPNGVLLLDERDQIEWCNSVAAAHFGLDPVRDLRQQITNLVRTPVFVAYLQERTFDEPLSMVAPRGDATLMVIIRPYGANKRLVLSQDVTERMRAEAMRRDFVANASHEIRTPLTVLAGFIETMTSLPLTEVERARVLTLMAQQTQRMQTLVGDLLALAQLEGSPRPPSDVWVSVANLTRQLHTVADSLSRGRHQVRFPAADDETMSGAQVAGVETELVSALTNLVSNAVRYTPDGGQIEMTWRLAANGSGEFAVRDTGIGIEREHWPRLTERFYRVDGSRSRETGGTGLGLSIVKHVVQRHGGQLMIDSEVGKGSTFRIALPASRVRFIEPAADPREQIATSA
jgi:two-component system, OmpR family, phosphate regulon sensor histidine kinase PhoR